MPSVQIQSSVSACNIRKHPSFVPREATDPGSELYLLSTNDTRGWAGADYHVNEQMYYGMLVQLEFNLSQIPSGVIVTSAVLRINVEFNPASVSPVVIMAGGSWAPPVDEGDYSINSVLTNVLGSISVPPGSLGEKVIPISTSAVTGSVVRFMVFAEIWGIGLEGSAFSKGYIRMSFPATLEVTYEVPAPPTYGNLEAVFSCGLSSGGTISAQARGNLEGAFSVVGRDVEPPPQAAHGNLEGVFLVDASRDVRAVAPGNLEGVFFVEGESLPRALGSLEGVFLVAPADSAGGRNTRGFLEGVFKVGLTPGSGGGGDVTYTDVLPFSVSAQAVVTIDRNALMLGTVNMGAVGSLVPSLSVGLLLPQCVMEAVGVMGGELGLSGEIEVEANVLVGGRLVVRRMT